MLDRIKVPILAYETSQVTYYGRQRERCGDAESSAARIFPALDFLAALCTHIPDPGQQLVRYYGAFSNVGRARVQAHTAAAAQPADPSPPNDEDRGPADEFACRLRSSWARLIKKVYEADPLSPLPDTPRFGLHQVLARLFRRFQPEIGENSREFPRQSVLPSLSTLEAIAYHSIAYH